MLTINWLLGSGNELEILPGEARLFIKYFLDAQKLVIFCNSIGA
jgi:hypothetical protein